MLSDLLASAGPLIDQSLSAAIATIAGSFFLYSLVKDIGNRVARVFSLLLFFVMLTYISDIGIGFTSSLQTTEAWLRFQWLGIAFVPAVYLHLSHTILTMTGLTSRGRRRGVVISMYGLAAIFLILVLFSDTLVRGVATRPAPHLQPGPLFPVFVAYFVGSFVTSFWFVLRARRRALTESTRRRLAYLVVPYVAPALSAFPFLLVSGQLLNSPALFYGILTLVDTALAVMLTFMAYSMAFLGSLLPDRLIKSQMMQFFLRGPVVAIATLAVIIWVPRASAVLGLPGNEVMPLLAVTVILFMQWAITLMRPYLDRWLIYTGDQDEIRHIHELEQRLITGADFHQLLDTILAAICDYLRVESAFVASITNHRPHLEHAIGLGDRFGAELEEADDLRASTQNGDLPQPEDVQAASDVFIWQGMWLLPLHVQAAGETSPRLVGLLGVAALAGSPDQVSEEQWLMLMALAARAAEVLEDRRVQGQVLASLKGLLPEMTALERIREASRQGGVEALITPTEAFISSEDFILRIKDALNHYWGGPNLTDNRLMSLAVVRQALEANEGNPQRAMRHILEQAIENLRPEGQRSMTTTEWILYNILEMRFVQGRKVRDVAMRLAMSESDLYRKQRVAIESVAAIIADMERAALHENGDEGAAGPAAPRPTPALPGSS